MPRILLFLYFWAYLGFQSNAQNVLWSNAYTNNNFNLSVNGIRSNSSGENYTVGSFAQKIDFDAGPGNDTLDAGLITNNNAIAGFISKTDNGGNHIWAKALIPYVATGRCIIVDVDMDANANVYVGGTFSKTVDFDPGPGIDSLNSNGNAGSFILKMDPAGNLIWAHTLLGQNTRIQDIIIDENDDLTVSGYFSDTVDFDPGPGIYNLIPGNIDEVFACKVNTNGSFLWARSWAASRPIGRASIDADDANNIYVSAAIFSYQIDLDPGPGVYLDSGQTMIVKLDPNGNFIWGRTRNDETSRVLASNSSNLYVYGSPDGYGAIAFLSYYDSTGILLWNKTLEIPGAPGQNFQGDPTALTQDQQGNLVMGGKFFNTYFLFSTDSAGNTLWTKRSSEGPFALHNLSVKMNPQNEIMVAGDFYNVLDVDFGAGIDTQGVNGKYSYFLMKYDYCGNLFHLYYSGCDSVVTPDSTYTASTEFAVEYPDVNGCDSTIYNHVTVSKLPDVTLTGCDSVVSNGQVYYQSGHYTQIVPPIVPGCDSILTVHVHISADTNLSPFMHLIQEVPDSLIASTAGSVSIDVDSLYNMFIGGRYSIYIAQLNLNPDVGLTARFDSSGALVWKHAVKHNSKSLVTRSVALNDNLGLLATTTFADYADGNTDQKGIVETTLLNNMIDDTTWIPNFPPDDKFYKVLNDPTSNNMVQIGTGPAPLLNNPTAVVVTRGNAVVRFASAANAFGSGICYGYTGAIDSMGNIYVAGKWQNAPIGGGPGQSGTYYSFIAKLDSNLNILWNRLLAPGTGSSPLTISNMKFSNNTLLTSGNFNKVLDLDYTANTYMIDPDSGTSFVARFDTAASILWATPFATIGTVSASGLTVDDDGQIYVGGRISDKVDLEPGPGITYFNNFCLPYYLGYISKFASTGTFIRTMGLHDYVTDLKFKSPDRIYTAGGAYNILVSVYQLKQDTTVYTYPTICVGDTFFVGASAYTQSGIYTNVFVGANNTDSVVITNLTVNPLPAVVANASDTIICMGAQLILFGSGANAYTWSNGVTDSIAFSPQQTTTYILTGTDLNGCVNTDSISIIVNALPAVLADANDTVLCYGDSVILWGSGALNYTWNNAVIDSIFFVPQATGYYTVTGVDTNGCANSDSILLTVNALPIVIAHASDTAVCIGNPVILYGSGADSFAWTNNVIDSVTFYPIDTAMYVVTGIDLNGCIGQDSIEVITYQIPIPILVFSGDTLYCTNVSNVTYYWFKDTVAIDSLINYYVVTQNGNYQVLVVDSNGCVGADSISMLNVSIVNRNHTDLIHVFPNPTSGELHIAFDMATCGDAELLMYDLLGKAIFSEKQRLQKSGRQLITINLKDLNINDGIYFLYVVIEGKRHVVKFEYKH